MSETAIEAAILSDVVSRFLNLKASTPRRDLIVKFRNVDVAASLLGLSTRRILLSRQGDNGEEYLPTAAAFQFSGNTQLIETAQLGLTTVLYALQNMAVGEPRASGYAFDDMKRHVHDIYPSRTFDDETLKLGLYLAQDFQVFSSFRFNPPGNTEIISFQVGEAAITMKDIDSQWDIVMSRYKRPVESEIAHAGELPRWEEAKVLFDQQKRSAVLPSGDYAYHPEIQKVSQTLFLEGHFRQAVLEAFIHLIAMVKEKTGLPYEGDDLMNRAFSPKDRNPPVCFNSLNTQGEKDEQMGIWFLFKGVVGLRNYKAHVVATFDDPHRAHEYLALASLLMRLLDTATIERPVTEMATRTRPAPRATGDQSKPTPQRSTNTTERDWIGEWNESKLEFTELGKSGVFAEFFQGNWSIRSDHDSLARDRMEAACELAGSRLLNSPGMSLSDPVRSQNEHWKQWLQFLKETQGLNRRIISGSGSGEDGYIERLAEHSALACTKCAAKAFN